MQIKQKDADICLMKIVLAQQNYRIGDFELNTRKIIEAIRQAKAEGADLIMFSEMCICGYPARDFVEFNNFVSIKINFFLSTAAPSGK